ncbi:MAG: HAD family phosphatase [Candidatus Omnitrophota bacterium]
MKDNRKIKAVIFDLGNVLVDFDHMIAARRISEFTDKAPRDIFDLFFDSELTALFEEGKISVPDFFSGVKSMLNSRLDYERFLPIWNEIFFLSENNRAVYELAKILKGRYKTALLSNVNTLHFDYLRNNFPVFDVFDKIITSFEAKARKPEPSIYNKALEALGSSPGETFYTDDRKELVESARGLGIRSFVFKDAKQLRKDLSESGVEIG